MRWDSEKEDELFLAQAATLKASYYNFQVFMHQPFTPSSSRPHPSLSSAICTNVARSSIQVLDVLYKRTGSLYYANMVSPGCKTKVWSMLTSSFREHYTRRGPY